MPDGKHYCGRESGAGLGGSGSTRANGGGAMAQGAAVLQLESRSGTEMELNARPGSAVPFVADAGGKLWLSCGVGSGSTGSGDTDGNGSAYAAQKLPACKKTSARKIIRRDGTRFRIGLYYLTPRQRAAARPVQK